MDDDTELLLAAAATAALFTWVGERGVRRGRRRGWRRRLRVIRAAAARSWRETPLYLIVTAVRDAFFRKR